MVHITHGNKVAHFVGATGDVHVVLGLHEGLAEHQLGPLGVGEHDGIAAGTVSLDGLGLEVQVGVFTAVVPLIHVVVTGKVVTAGLTDVGHRDLDTGDGAHGNLGFAGVSSLGGNNDNTVSTAHTEHGGGGGILQDGQALDFVGVYRVEGTFHTIHQDERGGVGVAQGRGATDVDLGIVFARLTGFLHGGNARHLTGQDVGHVGHRRLYEGFVVNGS